jgi:site-specific recombinase XerD
MSNTSTKRFGSVKGQVPANAGKEYPAEVLTTEEAAQIIGQCSVVSVTGIRNRALLMLLYRSGLRITEALNIRPIDVDLAHHSIRVLATKSRKAQTRGFHPSVDDALARWLDTRKGLGFKKGTPLFATLDGAPLSPQYVSQMLKRLAAQAGVERRVHPHGLRHAYAAELERSGVRLLQISRLLGHSSVAVTDRYLRGLTNAEAIAALEEIDLPPLERA